MNDKELEGPGGGRLTHMQRLEAIETQWLDHFDGLSEAEAEAVVRLIRKLKVKKARQIELKDTLIGLIRGADE